MNILIIGMGEVGRYLATTLSAEGHRIVAVDSSEPALALARSHSDIMTRLGHGSTLSTLRDAGAATADLVVAVTDSDEINLLASMMSKHLGAGKAIARVGDRAYYEHDGGVEQDVVGVDVLLNPQILAAMEIHRVLRSFGAVESVNLAGNRVEVVDLPVVEKTRYLGKQLREVSMPRGALIAAITRNGELFIPHGGSHVELGDKIWIIGDLDVIPRMEDMFGKTRKLRARRVMIVGGGRIGLEVARHLERDGIRVVLIEKDLSRCRELAEELHETLVIHGDGTNRSLLLEEEADTCDAFLGLTREDEVNIMSCLLAKGMGVDQSIALVHRGDYLPAARGVGLDVCVSPRRSAANFILASVRSGSVHKVVQVEDGKAEILELHVPGRARVLGRSLKYIDFPKGSLIGAVVREGAVFVPSGSDEIQSGDKVIVFTTPGARTSVVRMFKDPATPI